MINKLIEKLNAVHKEYHVLKLNNKESYKIFNSYGKVLGIITSYIIAEKGAYITLDGSITDLSLEEAKVIAQMVDIVDEYEKEI